MRAPGRGLLLGALAVGGLIPNAAASIIDTSGVVRTGDFDGDGHLELVVSSPETDCGKGAVYVVTFEGDLTTWTRDTYGVLGTAACGDQFGASLAVGDFDADGYDDLAIAAHGADDTGNAASGTVHILYGSATGLTESGDQLWTLDVSGVDGVAIANDHWGDALTAGDFNCDGYDDIAIGAPRKFAESLVSILYGTSGGITSVGDQLLSRAGGFGASLVAGNFDGDQEDDIDCDDLVVAAPFAQATVGADEGIIYRFAGADSGIDTEPTQTLHQDVTDVVDAPEAGDYFGWRLATVRVDDDAYPDLFVTVPGDACTTPVGSGRHLFYGSSGGLAVADNAITCDTYGCSVLDTGVLACHAGSAPAYGNASHDVISTGSSTGIVWGGAGDDALYGLIGDDVFFGGDGEDIIMPGPGRDIVIAGDGDDVIVIDLDCMVLEGEVVDGGPGDDTIRSHLSEYDLEALGLTIFSVENFVAIDENPLGESWCAPEALDDGPFLRPRVRAAWSGLTEADDVLTTTTGLLTLQLKNNSADDVDVHLEFVLSVRGEEVLLEQGPETVLAASTETVTLDLNDFIPGAIDPHSVNPALLVLPTSAAITTRAKLSVDSMHIGYSFAPTIFGHLEPGDPNTAVLYREGALHDTYYHGDLAGWRMSVAPYSGSANLMRRIEVRGTYHISAQ